MNHSQLHMLAIDQRPWLTQALYGHTGEATPDERAAICGGKHMVLDGLLTAIEEGSAQDSAAILVDDILGPGVAERARAHGITVSMPLEKAGLDLYEDQPDDVAAFLSEHRPDLAKVLVRYNPAGDREANALQRQRLSATAAAVHNAGCKFLFELLVPATPEQLKAAGDRETFDASIKPELILKGMEELSMSMEVDIWKLENLGTESNYADAVNLADAAGGDCILLGAGAPVPEVEAWLSMAARQGFSGFAIGRSIWWDSLRALLAGETDYQAAKAQVAQRYRGFAATFDRALAERAAGAANSRTGS